MRNHIGIGIHPTTNDWHFEGGNLVMVTKAHAVGQHVRQRLKAFEGEWFLDTLAGVPWLAELLGKQYDPTLAEAVVKAEILDTDAVTEITSFAVGFEKNRRELRIRDVEVLTTYDQEVAV